jgi:hypothetical protein
MGRTMFGTSITERVTADGFGGFRISIDMESGKGEMMGGISKKRHQ